MLSSEFFLWCPASFLSPFFSFFFLLPFFRFSNPIVVSHRYPFPSHSRLASRALINIGRDHDLSIERPSIADDICILRKSSKSTQIRSQCSVLLQEVEKYITKRQPLAKKLF